MDKIKLVPAFKDEIEKNSAWCVSFDVAWREFQENILKNKFKYSGKIQSIKNLIAECINEINLNDNNLYSISGRQTEALKKQIEEVLEKKFKTKSDLLNDIKFDNDDNTPNILIYAIFVFAFKFYYKFDLFPEKERFGKSKKLVQYFGVKEESLSDVRNQVYPLFYNADNDFAISIVGQDYKNIILYRSDSVEDFETTLKKIREKGSAIKEQEILMGITSIPNLKFNVVEKFDQLIGQKITRDDDGQFFIVSNAIQSLKFSLNNKGIELKSEALMSMREGAAYVKPKPIIKRDFIFNDSFYLYVFDKGVPVAAVRIENIDLFS